MQNYTTQEHHGNHEINVVEPNPGKTIAQLREKQRNRNLINGVVIASLALVVVLTGTLLGATTAHNNQLKSKLDTLQTQRQTAPQTTQQTTQQTTLAPDAEPDQDHSQTTVDDREDAPRPSPYWRYYRNTTSTAFNAKPQDFISQQDCGEPTPLPLLK